MYTQDYFANSKIRGLAPVPRACTFTYNVFRRGLAAADEVGDAADEEGTAAGDASVIDLEKAVMRG
jgi:hypothetical protein